jgi:ABC-type transport system substrate-binding protein
MKSSRIKLYSAFSMIFIGVFFAFSTSLAAEPKYGGTLKIGVRVPQYNRLDGRQLTVITMVPSYGMVYDPLFAWGKDGYDSLTPALATKYETKDNKVWTIHLRKGVKFHNGREMTAEDVKANFDWRITTPEGWKPVKYRSAIKYLKGAEVVDKYTVKIILDKPFAPLMRILAMAVKAILPPEEVNKWGKEFTAHPCGTGPFRVVEIKPKEKVAMDRFDGYWGPKPYLDRLEYKYIRSNDARLIALQKGEVDIAPLFD